MNVATDLIFRKYYAAMTQTKSAAFLLVLCTYLPRMIKGWFLFFFFLFFFWDLDIQIKLWFRNVTGKVIFGNTWGEKVQLILIFSTNPFIFCITWRFGRRLQLIFRQFVNLISHNKYNDTLDEKYRIQITNR